MHTKEMIMVGVVRIVIKSKTKKVTFLNHDFPLCGAWGGGGGDSRAHSSPDPPLRLKI